MSDAKFIGKKFSEKLDGNLSVALAGDAGGISTLACVIFMADGETMLASFDMDIGSQDLYNSMADGSLFSTIENLYLGMEQGMKNTKKDVCLH